MNETKEISALFTLIDDRIFTYIAYHDPMETDYPHSEVRAYKGYEHLAKLESVPEADHLEWRMKLLEAIEVIIPPGKKIAIRQQCPTSHVPETLS